MKSFFSPGQFRSRLLLKSLLLLGLATPLASAKVANYRYIRFHPLKLQGSAEAIVQLAEFQFFNGSTPIPTAGVVVTDPNVTIPVTTTSETPDKAYDGITTATANKWLDKNYLAAYLTFDFGSAKPIDRYNYVTGGDAATRDPVSWIVEGSADGFDWALLDTVYDNPPNTARNKPVAATNFVFPDHPLPVISNFALSFNGQPAIVPNGSTMSFFVETLYAASAQIRTDVSGSTATTVGNPANDDVTVAVPSNRDTIFTLTATTAGASVTKSLTLRSVQQQTMNYRYVRYTPRKLRGGGTALLLSDFEFSKAGVKVPISSATNIGGTVNNDGTPVSPTSLLIDDNSNITDWTSNLAPVIFDLGSTVSFDAYSFGTGNAANPEKDPVQWTLEGSTDNINWSLIDNVTAFDYPTPTTRFFSTGNLPTPGTSAIPYASLSSEANFSSVGEAVVLDYVGLGAATASISPNVPTTGTSGSVTVHPQETTTYTLTVTSAAGKVVTKDFTVTVTPSLGSINYPNFESSSDINLVGTSQVLNDFATFSNSPNAKRLRLTGLVAQQSGAAWSRSKLNLRDGFQTSFDAHLAYPVYVNGADGVAFTVNNTAAKFTALPASGFSLGDKSLSIALVSFPTGAVGLTQANLEIFPGSGAPILYNLNKSGLGVARGYKGNYLVTNPTAAPYHVDVIYTPGSLSVYVDNVLVADRLAINLATLGAVDEDGKAYSGFSARTRYIVAYHDIVNWSVTPGLATTPLAITNSAFTFGATPQVSLTFSSTSGKTYQVTQSADLVSWAPLGATVTASSATTTTTLPFTAAPKLFFRVEQTN